MKPLSDFTTPRRLMALISRHFFPVEHPEPPCCTTGLKNGSRLPFIAHFFSSALGLDGSLFAKTGSAAATAVAGFAGATIFAVCFGSDFGSAAIALGAAIFATATLGAGAALAIATRAGLPAAATGALL